MFGKPIFGWLNDFTPNATYNKNGTLIPPPISGTNIVIHEVFRYSDMNERNEANDLIKARASHLKVGRKRMISYDLEWIEGGYTHTTVFANYEQFNEFKIRLDKWKNKEKLDQLV